MSTIRFLYLQQKTRQHRQTVDVGHGDVENDHVRIELLKLLERIPASRQGGYELHVGLRTNPAGDQPAYHRRVIDQHDPDRLAYRRRACRDNGNIHDCILLLIARG
jgi:hypothetical protein